MTHSTLYPMVPANGASAREMVEALRNATETNYDRLLRAAGHEWERRFAGDPSDACARVQISAWSNAFIGQSSPARPALESFSSQAA